MKLYRLTIYIPTGFAYMEYEGFDIEFAHNLLEGKRASEIDSSKIIMKNITKKFPNLIGVDDTAIFVDKELKIFLEKETLSKNLNFIEVIVKNKEYYLLNILGLCDYMDYENSIYTTFEDVNEPDEITKLVIKKDQLIDNMIFRLKEQPTHVFVTEQLKEKIESQNFTGIEFIQAEDLTKDY